MKQRNNTLHLPMNKITIKDLLNTQYPTKNSNERKKINQELFRICSFLPNYTTGFPEKVTNLLDYLYNKLREFNEVHPEPNLNEVKTTYQICKLMQEIIKRFPKEITTEEDNSILDDDPVFFNTMTKDMMNKNKKVFHPYRGHRFSSDNIIVLEHWYNEHYQKPYLTKSSLETLSKLTGLEKIQIRNWVSNRRRKEKSVQVSSTILDLVQDK